MEQLERKITITFRWWNDETEEINPRHAEALEESAINYIFSKYQSDRITSGELSDNLCMSNADPDCGVDYQGWYEIKIETL
jgi:hypothetical protein